MYKVSFNAVPITEFDKEPDAIQFAVGLHLTSSVEHTIEVCKDNGFICSLIRK